MAESGIVRIYRKVSSFYFSLLPEPFLWFFLLIWLMSAPPFFTELSLPILDKFSLSTCAKDLSIPVFILLFSFATGILLSPRKNFSTGVVISLLNIFYNLFSILYFLNILDFKYIIVLVFIFPYLVESDCTMHGCIVSMALSIVYISIYCLASRNSRSD